MFAIVEFTETKEVEIIPIKWITGDISFWPPFKSSFKTRKLIRDNAEYDSNWPTFAVRTIKTYGNYNAAREKLSRAEDSSNLDTEAETPYSQGKMPLRRRNLFNADKIILPSPPPIIIAVPPVAQNEIEGFSFDGTLNVYDDLNNVATTEKESDFECRVMAKLELISLELEQNKRLIHELVRKSRSSPSSFEAKPVNMPPLPIPSLDHISEWEIFLQNSEENFDFVSDLLCAVGGTNLEHVTRRVMKRILNCEVAQNYNWAPKLPFKTLKISSLVIVSVQKAMNNKEIATQHKIEEVIKSWLKYAPLRVLNKQKKKKKVESFSV